MKRATSHVDGLTRVELFGLDFVDDTSIARVADLVLDSTPDDVEGHPVIVTPNTDLLLQVTKTPDARIREFFAKAWCVLPDGQPIVWASRILGSQLRFRLTGSDTNGVNYICPIVHQLGQIGHDWFYFKFLGAKPSHTRRKHAFF